MKQIFYDPNLKRWKRLRRITDVALLLSTLIGVLFIVSVVSRQPLPDLLIPAQKRNYKALKDRRVGDKLRKKLARDSRRRSTDRLASQIPLNQDEGLRAAFYQNDEPSYSSLKQHIHQIDMLFPDWLHVTAANGDLIGATPEFPIRLYRVVDQQGVHGVDPENRVSRLIAAAREDMEVFPMLNDYDPATGDWKGDAIGKLLEDPAARERLHIQLDKFLAANPGYHGICLDFEQDPVQDRKLYT